MNTVKGRLIEMYGSLFCTGRLFRAAGSRLADTIICLLQTLMIYMLSYLTVLQSQFGSA